MKTCANCGSLLPDEAAFCANCGQPMAAEPAYEPAPVDVEPYAEDIPAEQPKKKHRGRAVVAIVGAVAVLFFTFEFCFNLVGLFSPMGRVARAAMRTLKADSLTLSIEQKTEMSNYYNEQSATMRMVVDQKEEVVDTYIESSYCLKYGETTERHESVSATANGREYSYSTRDGVVTYGRISETDNEEYFEFREQLEEDIDWDDVIEDADLEDYLREDEMDRFVRQLFRKYFGNRRWLKKNAGYTKKGNTYTFRPDGETFFEALADIVDESNAFTRKGKKEVEEGIEEILDALEESDAKFDVEVSFTVKGRYLSNIHIAYDVDAEGENGKVEMDIGISDVNRTKISKADVRGVKNTVNEYLEAEGIEYDECDECDDFGRMYDYNGKEYCYECYSKRKYG